MTSIAILKTDEYLIQYATGMGGSIEGESEDRSHNIIYVPRDVRNQILAMRWERFMEGVQVENW